METLSTFVFQSAVVIIVAVSNEEQQKAVNKK